MKFLPLLLLFVAALAAGASAEKVAVVIFNYTAGSFEPHDQLIMPGLPPKQLAGAGGMRADALFENGTVVSSVFLGNPLDGVEEEFFDNGTITGARVVLNETTVTIVLPFRRGVQGVELSYENGSRAAVAGLSEALAFYCGSEDGACDGDCGNECETPAGLDAVATIAANAATTAPSATAEPSPTPLSNAAPAPARDYFGVSANTAILLVLAALVLLWAAKRWL